MNVLFIGFGSIAKKHFAALRQLRPAAKIFALRSGVKQEPVADVVNLYSWEEIPAEISFAIVSTPTHLHIKALAELVERKIPIFLEKPISDKLDGLDELAAELEKSETLSYVACNLRFLPVLAYLKRYLEQTSPRINEINVYCGSHLPDWRPGQDYRNVYSAHPETGGGVHLDLFHEFDYICWIWGLPQQVHSLLSRRSSLGIQAPDYANYQLVYDQYVTQITLNYYRRDPKRLIEIICADNTLYINLLLNKITDQMGNLIFEDKFSGIQDTYLAQMDYFLAMLDNKVPPLNSFSTSLEILKICLSDGDVK